MQNTEGLRMLIKPNSCQNIIFQMLSHAYDALQNSVTIQETQVNCTHVVHQYKIRTGENN